MSPRVDVLRYGCLADRAVNDTPPLVSEEIVWRCPDCAYTLALVGSRADLAGRVLHHRQEHDRLKPPTPEQVQASNDRYWGTPNLIGLTRLERIRAVLHAVAYIDVQPEDDADWYDEMACRIDAALADC